MKHLEAAEKFLYLAFQPFPAWRCSPESFWQEMPLALVRDTMQFGELLPTLLCSVLAGTTSVQRTTFLSQQFLPRILWMARKGTMKEIGKICKIRKKKCHYVGFPHGRNYSSGIGDACAPQDPKWAAATITPLAQKLTKQVPNQ